MAMRQWWGQKSFRDRVAVVALLGLIWRLVYVNLETPYRILTDEAWYVTQAQRLFGPHAFTSLFDYSVPTAQHGPLMSVLIAPIAWLFPGATEGLRFFIPLLGIVTIVGFAMVGRAIGGDRVGITAGVAAAIFPDFWIRDGLVVAEPLAVAITIWMIFSFLKLTHHRTTRWSVLTGVLAGALVLARAEAIVLATVVVLIAMWSMRDDWRAAVRVGSLVTLCVALIVAPWIAFNSGRFERSVSLTNNLGITLAGANCHATYFDGRYIGYDTPICWNAAQAKARVVSPDESVQSVEMTRMGLNYAREHIGRVPLVVIMRELWMVGLYHPSYVVKMSALGGQPRWATWVQAGTFLPLLLLTTVLVVRRRRSLRAFLPGPIRQLLWIHVLFALFLAALFVGHWRYRSTLDSALIILASLLTSKPRTSE